MGTYSDPALILPGVVGRNELAVEVIGDLDNVRSNVALNAFRIATNGALTRFNLHDGVVDDFNDGTGIASSGLVSGGKLYTALLISYTGATASASSTGGANYPPSDAINGTAVDVSDVWVCDEGAAVGQWLKVQFPAAVVARMFEYHTRNYTPTFNYMSGFIVQGSNDDATWVDLKNVTGQVMETNTSYMFEFENSTAYVYYRILETARTNVYTSANHCSIGYCNFYGAGDVDSVAITDVGTPSNIHIVALADITGFTLNTNFIISISVDAGTTWTALTLTNQGLFSSGQSIVTGSVLVAGTVTDIRYRISGEVTNMYAVAILWD